MHFMGDTAALSTLVKDLRTIFGGRLRSLVVYGEHDGLVSESASSEHTQDLDGPRHTLAHVESLTLDDLRVCATYADRWTAKALDVPLFLAGDEFARSLDAFPIEYGAIMADYRVIVGPDPFEGLRVRQEDLRRACEVQAKSHVIHLREGFIETGGRGADLASLIAASAQSFRILLMHVARLQGEQPSSVDALIRFAGTLRLPLEPVRGVLMLRSEKDLGPIEAERIFPDYLAAAERLAHFVDTWAA